MRWSELSRAIDRRLGHERLLEEALHEPIPGGASFAYVFGSAALILFLVQVGTGLVLATYYSPSATDAWASVAYIEREVTFGALLRGMHHYTAGGMVAIVLLHLLQVVLYGAYKAPREANWISGLLLLALTLAFALTGYLLPWDQTGYWATKVATSIAGTLPVLGPLVQQVIQGGNDYGNLTLTRFYTIHVVALPLALFGILGVHLALFRKHGVTWSARLGDEEARARTEPFFPKQVLYDAIFAALCIAVLAGLAMRKGAPLEAPADPSSNFIARPEWYFLFLFQLLKYFEGPLQIVGTVVLPGLVASFLLVLPFLDRGPSRLIRARKPWVGAVAFGLVAVVALTGLALRHDAKDPKIAEQKEVAAREAQRARLLAAEGVPPEGAAYMLAHDPLTRGERVFTRECASCHPLEGKAPDEIKGPDLTAYRSAAWVRQVLRDADGPRLFGHTKISGMKSFAALPAAELEALIQVVMGLRAHDARPIQEHRSYALLQRHECTKCHEFDTPDAIEGPSLKDYLSPAWVAQVVDDASADHLYGSDNTMPVFAQRMSPEDRAAVVRFLLSLESRGPRDAWPYVDEPVRGRPDGAKGGAKDGGR